MRTEINTDKVPAAIGCYSQAVQVGNTFYFSGQIPIDPATMTMVTGIHSQITRVFENVKLLAEAAGGSLDQIVKLTVYLMDISSIEIVNKVMEQYFAKPYPARTSIAVAALPKNALVEVEAIMVLQ